MTITEEKTEKKTIQWEMDNLQIKKAKNGKPYAQFNLLSLEDDEKRTCIMWDSDYDRLKDKMKNGNIITDPIGTFSTMFNNWNITGIGELVKEGREGITDKEAQDIIQEVMALASNANIDITDFFMSNVEKILVWPAAKGIHHAYKGGLLQHTKEVIDIAKALCEVMEIEYEGEMYNNILAACALHDLYKIKEYTFENNITGSNDSFYDEDISHTLAMFAQLTNVNPRVAVLIGAHHGRVEWGALKEADKVDELIVHYADMLSSRGGKVSVRDLT